ncbi:uncharacterized protein LOC115323230 [Ixodes scapularis]|uniref:uncharacterized protein LOC115323230 n=1 Tax=Ixodes scapularis TaxID=6945 RepID=UPI001C3823B9|nr:uncharacterized protein LOC115323230 [Ixodes scapularis]
MEKRSAAMDDEVAQASEPNSSPPLDSEPQAANDDSLRNGQQRQEADELLRKIQEEHWRHHAIAAENPAYAQNLRQILSGMKKVQREPELMACVIAIKAVYARGKEAKRRRRK